MFRKVETPAGKTGISELTSFISEKVSDWWTSLKETIFDAQFWTDLGNSFSDIWTGLKNWWNDTAWPGIIKWWNGIWEDQTRQVVYENEDEWGMVTVDYVIDKGLKSRIKDFFTDFWTKDLQPWLIDLWYNIQLFLQPLLNWVRGIWNEIVKPIQNDKQVVGSTLYALQNLLPWNWWKVQTGERSAVGNAWDIPTSAKGNVFSAPSLSWVGESSTRNNPEIITPQNLLDERLLANNKYLLGAINSMTNNIVDAVNDISMDVKIGDETIAKSAGRGNQAYYRMTGKSLLN